MPSLFKDCVTCGVPRESEAEYYPNGYTRKDGSKGKRKDCVYCCRERRKNYFLDAEKRTLINVRRRSDYSNDGDYRKTRNRIAALKSLYGISLQRFDEMRAEQDYKCAICSIHESEAVRGKLYVDHSHKTGQIRGLLCAKCNSAIGLFKEDLETMQRAKAFLELQE